MEYSHEAGHAHAMLAEPAALKLRFNLSERELQHLAQFGSANQQDITRFIDDFYVWMKTLPEFDSFFKNPEIIQRVKTQQASYWKEFFQAEITSTYLANRIHVGTIHATIGLPIHSYCAAMNFSSAWWIKKIVTHQTQHSETTMLELLTAFFKLVQLDISLITEVYHQQTQEQLSQTLGETKKIVSDVTAIAESVVAGDFSKKLNDDRSINIAINKMIDSLNVSAKKTHRDHWIKNGQEGLAEKMRGDQDLFSLSQAILAFLAEYCAAKVGVFYTLTNENKLKLMGSYAYEKRKHLSNEFEIGEGVLGQAALEKKTMIIDNLPDHYLTIHSGLGESTATSVLVHPITLEGKVTAIMELGIFGSFNELCIELLKLCNDAIAYAIESAKNREQMTGLVGNLQKQSEELEKQKVELAKNNAALEEQTKKIKASEEELKSQSEELQATNEELEEKTQALEKQKREIEQQNASLEKSKLLLQSQAKNLTDANKYKSEFLSNMSHEFRTPLNSLMILSQSLLENEIGNLTKEQLETVDIIYRSGKDLLNLINDILDLSKVEAGKLQIDISEFSPSLLIKNLCSKLNPVASKQGITLETNTDYVNHVTMHSDAMRLEQILKNLISNAIKFTEKNGNVLVKSYLPNKNELDEQKIQLNHSNSIAFTIQDNGIGISEDFQNRLFEAFQQSDGAASRKRSGTGLGLAISKNLTALLGGEIRFKSKIDQGSIFTVYFPIKASSEPSKISIKKSNQSDQPILIIEDDEQFNQILQKYLVEKKIAFEIATTGEVGLKKSKKLRPKAIILDIILPDMNGLDLLERLQHDQNTQHIPIHVVSSADVRELSIQKGAVGFIRKPIDKNELLQLLDRAANIIQSPVQNVLLVGIDEEQKRKISALIKNENIQLYQANTEKEAGILLGKHHIHCMIIDFDSSHLQSMEFLSELNKNNLISTPSLIVYTSRDLTIEEKVVLDKYSPSIVLKTADSPQRVIDELSLFLKKLESQDKEDHDNTLVKTKKFFVNKKILIVDDDMRNNISLASCLRKHGMEIVTADNGELALERLSEEKNIDLVLMDIMMPVMDGYMTMEKIRSQKQFQKIPIIALTAKAMSQDREKCIQAGANDYITKPVDLEKLFSVLHVWLNK